MPTDPSFFDNRNNDSPQADSKATKAQQQQLDKINKVLSVQAKLVQAATKQLREQPKAVNAALRAHVQHERVLRQQIKTQERMLKQERQIYQQRERIARLGGGTRGGGLGLSLGSIIGAGAVFAAVRKVQSIAERQIQAAIVAGVGNVTALRTSLPAGVLPSRALGLLGALQQSATLRFRTPGVSEATGKLAASVKGLGDQGTELVAQFVRSIEPALQQAFIKSVNTEGVKAAVEKYATGQNIGLATSLINAQRISAGGTGEPLIDAAVSVQQSFDSLNGSIEQTVNSLAKSLLPAVEKLSGLIQSLSPRNVLLAGGGALALGLGGRGLVGGIGSGLKTAGGAALAGIGGVGAGALAVGTAGALGIDYLRHGKSVQSEFAAADLANKVATQQADAYAAVAKSMDGLKQQRATLVVELAKYESANERSSIARFFGASTFSPESARVIQDYRDKIQALTDQMSNASQSVTTLAQAEGQLKTTREATSRFEKLQQMSALREAIEPQVRLAASGTNIAREALVQSQLAAVQGLAGLTPAQQKFNTALLGQVEQMRRLLETIDQSSDAGVTEANNIRAEIMSLRNQAAQQGVQQYTLMLQDYTDKLNIARLQYQVASTTPLGIIGALQELRDLDRRLNEEIGRIGVDIKELQSRGSEEALREARRLTQQQLALQG